MALFVDSADLRVFKVAQSLGFIWGATTNPALLSSAGHEDPIEAMIKLCKMLQGPVFYQLTERSVENMRREAAPFMDLATNLGLKIMCTVEGLQFSKEIAGQIAVGITGVFAPPQAYVAAMTGARYVIPYINRINRYSGAANTVINEIAAILSTEETEILAAGIKSPQEAIETLLAGADHVSLPIEVIKSMAENDLTLQAFDRFDTYLAR